MCYAHHCHSFVTYILYRDCHEIHGRSRVYYCWCRRRQGKKNRSRVQDTCTRHLLSLYRRCGGKAKSGDIKRTRMSRRTQIINACVYTQTSANTHTYTLVRAETSRSMLSLVVDDALQTRRVLRPWPENSGHGARDSASLVILLLCSRGGKRTVS